jgi:hypothetical protein
MAILFPLRRLILVIIALEIKEFPLFQIIGVILLNLGIIIYILLARPFADLRDQRLEVFNELCFIALCLHLFAYTEYIEEPDV